MFDLVTTLIYSVLAGLSLFWAIIQHKSTKQLVRSKSVRTIQHVSVFIFSILLTVSTGSFPLVDFEIARIYVRVAMFGLLVSYVASTVHLFLSHRNRNWPT